MWTLPRSEIERLLLEDVPAGDLTTEALGIADRKARMTFRARGEMTVAGIEVARDMMLASRLSCELRAGSGSNVAAGDVLLAAEGRAGRVHAAWKAAQTLVEILSGIATAARAMVDAAAAVDPQVRIACTRKTFPGGRRLSHLAVRAGGAIVHRAGLSETLLVFPEHRVFSAEPLARLVTRLRREAPEKRIVIEATSVAEAREAIAAGADVVQLEKLAPVDIAEVAGFAKFGGGRSLVAAAGGIHAGNVAEFVRAGAGLIVTSWPYTARPADVAVTVEAVGA